MPVPLKAMKRALRHCRNDECSHAVLELNALINEHPDAWIAYCIRGAAHAGLKHNFDAISDYAQVLKQADYLNARNRAKLLDHIIMLGINQSTMQSQRYTWTPPRTVGGLGTAGGLKLFSIDDNMIDKIFSAKSSSGSGSTVDWSRSYSSNSSKQANVGRIAAVGRFLLDQSDIAKITYLVSNQAMHKSNVRRLTLQAAENLDKLLQKINLKPKVVGSCVIGRDGFLLASTLPKEDVESFGMRSLAFHLSASIASKKIGDEEVRQSLMRSTQGYIIIFDFSGGILVTVTNEKDTAKSVKLMEKIKKLSGKCDYAIPPAPYTVGKAHPAC